MAEAQPEPRDARKLPFNLLLNQYPAAINRFGISEIMYDALGSVMLFVNTAWMRKMKENVFLPKPKA